MIPLIPGDVLLYSGHGIMSRLIQTKTFSHYSHCEGYIGQNQSVASRDGIGVGLYSLREADLALVLRPIAHFDLTAAMAWFKTVDGQHYDWLGLFAFFAASWQASPSKMFCSEFLARWQRAGGIVPFAPNYDADHVSPGMFASSPAYNVVSG